MIILILTFIIGLLLGYIIGTMFDVKKKIKRNRKNTKNPIYRTKDAKIVDITNPLDSVEI